MPSPSKKRSSSAPKPRPTSAASGRPKPAPKPVAKKPATPAKPPAKKPAGSAKSKAAAAEAPGDGGAIPRRGDGRRHLLSLAFLRDGDEFMARLETDAGQITELKNRSLDQLLTLVAGELEDLLE